MSRSLRLRLSREDKNMSGAEFFARALLTEGPLRDMAEERVKQAFKHAKHGQGAVLRFNANGNHEQAYPKDLKGSSRQLHHPCCEDDGRNLRDAFQP